MVADVGRLTQREQMFGFHDFTTDPRTGRPQPHSSWLGESLITWSGWASAAISLVGGFMYFLKWHELDGLVKMVLATVLLALIAYWRQRMLARKRAAYEEAATAYEVKLSRSVNDVR